MKQTISKQDVQEYLASYPKRKELYPLKKQELYNLKLDKEELDMDKIVSTKDLSMPVIRWKAWKIKNLMEEIKKINAPLSFKKMLEVNTKRFRDINVLPFKNNNKLYGFVFHKMESKPKIYITEDLKVYLMLTIGTRIFCLYVNKISKVFTMELLEESDKLKIGFNQVDYLDRFSKFKPVSV